MDFTVLIHQGQKSILEKTYRRMFYNIMLPHRTLYFWQIRIIKWTSSWNLRISQ